MDRPSEQACAATEDMALSDAERADLLLELAIGLQRQLPSAEDPEQAGRRLGCVVELYDRALALCPPIERLRRARITVRRAMAVQAIPGDPVASLQRARDGYRAAVPVLVELGTPEEVGEAELNHGLVLQTLAVCHRAEITDAIGAYQRALQTFDRARFPREFAILQNNLATAYLSMPASGEREALAARAFADGLQIVSLLDHPIEYAMLQHNLGNALQYASSRDVVDNQLRALDAYDEALKVRSRDAMPLAYANTISNKACCLWNLAGASDGPAGATGPTARGGLGNLRKARAYYGEARAIFVAHGETERALAAGRSCNELDRELLVAAGGGDRSVAAQ